MKPNKTPLTAIRAFCMACQGDYAPAVADCLDTACPFHPYRHGTPLAKGQHRPTSTIRRYCLEYCQAGAGPEEVRTCAGDTALLGPCQVFPFRFGTNPNIRPETRAKHRKAALERDPLGLNLGSVPQAQRPTQAPQSTKNIQATLY